MSHKVGGRNKGNYGRENSEKFPDAFYVPGNFSPGDNKVRKP